LVSLHEGDREKKLTVKREGQNERESSTEESKRKVLLSETEKENLQRKTKTERKRESDRRIKNGIFV
jgi:hypothetical protein